MTTFEDAVGSGRLALDSVDMTHVKAPNPTLLAIARGEAARTPSRRAWFGLGMIAGAALMWLAIGNVRTTIDTVRGWFGDVTRTVHGAASRGEERAPSEGEARVDGSSSVATAALRSSAEVPVVNFAQLPRVKHASSAPNTPPAPPPAKPAR